MAVAPGKLAEWAFKILSVLVIPLLLWGIRLERVSAVQAERITRLQQDVVAASAISTGVVENSKALVRVEVKLDGTNKRLDEIRADIRRSLPPPG